ncbi:Uncharacterised protein [Actinobacillus equuli]|nr:Uncharacterised protein [Actinobacillus equuli]
MTLGISRTAETIYLGQRHNIVTFFQNYDEYSGGAHNNYHTKYFNIDVNKNVSFYWMTYFHRQNK